MSLFSFGGKKNAAEHDKKDAYIQVLGAGCPKCKMLESNAKEAVRQLGREDEVSHIKEFETIMGYGVMQTPALVIGGKVVSSGRVLSAAEIKELLEDW